MIGRIVLPNGNDIVLAQVNATGSARTDPAPHSTGDTSGTAADSPSLGAGEAKGPTKGGGASGKSATAGSVKIGVHPDLSGLPGAQSASQQGINLISGIVIVGLAIFALIGVIRVAAGNGLDFPDHAQGGKKMLIYTPVLAAIAAMIGQLVGWGWDLGAA